MSVQLLDRTRKIQKILSASYEGRVLFSELVETATAMLDASFIAFDKAGNIISMARPMMNSAEYTLFDDIKGDKLDEELNDRFLDILSTKENVSLETLGLDTGKGYTAIVSPIFVDGKRLGTLFAYRINKNFEIDDIIIAELVSSVIGIFLLKDNAEAKNARDVQKKLVKRALLALTETEKIAVEAVFNSMDGYEGVIIASNVADEVGITRSIVVNALKKLDSAGIITCRSKGKMGTYIKVTNDILYEALDKERD